MSYTDAFKALSGTFTEAVQIANPKQIDQAGTYLLFGSSKPINLSEHKPSFILVLCANSYEKKNGLIPLIDEMTDRIKESTFAMELVSIKRAELLSTTLYSVALEISIEINITEE